jgi:hypothetical protein
MNIKNPLLILLASLILHAHFRETSIGEAIAVASLCAAYGYSLLLESKKEKPINDEVKKELAEMRSILLALKVGRAFGK